MMVRGVKKLSLCGPVGLFNYFATKVFIYYFYARKNKINSSPCGGLIPTVYSPCGLFLPLLNLSQLRHQKMCFNQKKNTFVVVILLEIFSSQLQIPHPPSRLSLGQVRLNWEHNSTTGLGHLGYMIRRGQARRNRILPNFAIDRTMNGECIFSLNSNVGNSVFDSVKINIGKKKVIQKYIILSFLQCYGEATLKILMSNRSSVCLSVCLYVMFRGERDFLGP